MFLYGQVNILFTANFQIFNDVQNALHPTSNEDGCHYLSSVAFEEAAISTAQNPAKKRSEHGLFLFFDSFKLLFRQLLFEDIDQAPDRLIRDCAIIIRRGGGGGNESRKDTPPPSQQR